MAYRAKSHLGSLANRKLILAFGTEIILILDAFFDEFAMACLRLK